MLFWLLATCLLSAGHTSGDLEAAWPFGDSNYVVNLTSRHQFAPFVDALPDQCMLWDTSCSGNRTEALDEFFNNTGTMMQLVYVGREYWDNHRKDNGIPPDTNAKILSWMRDPDCRSSFLEWHTEHPDQPTWTYTDRIDNTDVLQTVNWDSIATTSVPYGCCDACQMIGGDVDVFYWPVAGANTDCLASVGTTAASTIDQNLIITDARGLGGGWWNPQPNPYNTSALSSSNPALLQSIIARGHALISAPANSSESQTIVTQNGFTFTSPSVYVGFSSLYAVDRCGAVGTFINYTMLAFTPGELSTIEVPAWERASIPLSATKSFNFADLPCPPQSVMIADQYKPAPGSPYRPVLSPPAQLYSLQSGWPNCVITHAFAGIDPPRALMPAAALVPHQTPASPQSQITTADPEKIASRSPEASVTGATRDPPPAPAHRSTAAGPTSTTSPSAPSTAVKDPHTSKTSLDPQNAQYAKILPQPNGWQASEVASEMQVSSEEVMDSSIQDSFKDGSFISPPRIETSREPVNAVQPSSVSSDQKSDQKATLSPNPVTSDPLPTSKEHDEDGATRPSTRTDQDPSLEDDPSRARASSVLDTSPSSESLRQGSKHPQGTSTAEAELPRPAGHSNGDISIADGELPDPTKGNTNGPPTPIINNPPPDPAAVANTAEDLDPGSQTASSSPSPPHDASPNDQGNPYPQLQTSPLPSNADGESAPIPPSTSKPLLQTFAPETPPSSTPSHSNPTTLESDPSASKGADPGSSEQGPSSIEVHSQSQSPADPALGHNQTTTTAAAAQAAFQPPTNNTNTTTDTNVDPKINILSAASGSRAGGGKKAQPSPSSPSRSGKNSDGNTSSVLPFQNGGEGKRIGVAVWIVGLGGCVVTMFSYYSI